MVACYTIYDYEYISSDYLRAPFRLSMCSTKWDGIWAKFAPYLRDVIASRKTNRNNKHNSMSSACASLINYSSWVIEVFANSAGSFIRRGWRRALLCETSASYSHPC